MIPICIGYDPRESIAYHVLEQSILNTCSLPVAIIPLHAPMLRGFDGQQDGTNAFTYSRFLVPDLMDFQGWALYLDSDMLLRRDLAILWDQIDDSKAVMACQHEYETTHHVKLVGTPMEARNESYPRKNWSSLVLWNCGHPMNRILTKEFVSEAGGKRLHRFEWLNDEDIGSIPLSWNHLVTEQPKDRGANLVHFTLGVPGFEHYRDCDYSDEWNAAQLDVNHVETFSIVKKSGGAYG